MVSTLIGKRLCRLGVHTVKVWNYRRDGVCTQDGICQRCTTEFDRVEHVFHKLVWDYIRKRPLMTETDRCTRCHELPSDG